MEPTVGCIVNYQPIGDPKQPQLAAIITATNKHWVKLSIFRNGHEEPSPAGGWHGYAGSPTPGRWGWPPR